MKRPLPEIVLGFLLGVTTFSVAAALLAHNKVAGSDVLALIGRVVGAIFGGIHRSIMTATGLSNVPEGAIDALLHLGAIAVVFTAVYLGVDDPEKVRRFYKEAQGSERAARHIDEIIATLLADLDLSLDSDWLYDFFGIDFYVLQYIAYRKKPSSLLRRARLLGVLLWRTPLFWYYDRNTNLRVVTSMCLVSTLLFFLLAGSKIWDLHWPPLVLVFSYLVFVAVITWSFITLFALHRLSSLGTYMDQVMRDVDARLNKVLKAKLQKVADGSGIRESAT